MVKLLISIPTEMHRQLKAESILTNSSVHEIIVKKLAESLGISDDPEGESGEDTPGK